MDEQLISKKNLLEKYNISYGALYRWKRKGLIPDEWFIKKSTVTGQETFFPKKLVCERIEKIQSMKDDILLDELAKRLSGEEKNNEFLTVKTGFGDKRFKMSEISGIYLTDKNGTEKEVTAEIKRMLEEKKFGFFKKK